MGRRPEGEQALTGAGRQARYRQRPGQAQKQGPVEAMPRRLPRGAHSVAALERHVAGLLALRDEYARWLEALPEATRDTATGEALRAMVDLDLEEIMAIKPPRGFGPD